MLMVNHGVCSTKSVLDVPPRLAVSGLSVPN